MESWFTADSNERVMDAGFHVRQPMPFDDELDVFFHSLSLFELTPISQIIADERLLPVEALRVFYVNPCWRASLLDGARSIGRNSTRDILRDKAIAEDYAGDFANQMGFTALRNRLRMAEPAGLLLRGGKAIAGFASGQAGGIHTGLYCRERF